jgi:hypothetical protein
VVTAFHQGRIRKGSAFFIPYHYYFPKREERKRTHRSRQEKEKRESDCPGWKGEMQGGTE